MKFTTDLFTSIIAAIVGILIAFFVTNIFMGPIEDVTYKKVSSNVDATLSEPDPEIFNYKALNPTVEVYVGECEEYNRYGECIDSATQTEIETETIEIKTTPSSQSNNTPSEQSVSETVEQETR